MMFGGHQERGRRGGTQNTAGIVGLGTACEIIAAQDSAEHERIRAMRDRLEREIAQRFESSYVVGAGADRLPNTACICFAGIEAEAALLLLSEANICVSSGAACSSGSLEPSHVLHAMGIEPRIAQGEIRISVSRYNTDSDVTAFLNALPRVIDKLSVLTN
jgi:cysteine desulfurase